jgi:U3 small nucleolar RNA-associated protein 22
MSNSTSKKRKVAASPVSSDDEYEYLDEIDGEGSQGSGGSGGSGDSDDSEDVDSEDVDSEGDEDNEMQVTGGNDNTKQSKKKSKALPTKDEQSALRSTEILMKSNLMQLQITEMLNEVKASPILEKKEIKAWLQAFTEVVKGMKNKSYSGNWLSSVTHAKDVVTLTGYNSSAISIDFKAPSSIDIIGSSKLQTDTAPFLNIDINLTMPVDCMEERDILNHVYFDKRKLYLVAITEALSKNASKLLLDGDNCINYAFFKGDNRKPIISLTPSTKKKVVIRIFVSPSTQSFNVNQLRVTKNNIRPKEWMDKIQDNKNKNQHDSLDVNTLLPTPFYNLAILEDLSINVHHQILTTIIKACPAARDAIILLKIWLTQRSFRYGVDGIDGHTIALLVCYLYQMRKVTNQSTAYGIFLVTIKFLVDQDLTAVMMDFSTVDTVPSTAPSSVTTISSPAASLVHPIVGMEGKTVAYNLLWRVSKASLADIRDEARHTYSIINDDHDGKAFHAVFITPKSFYDRHDDFYHISMNPNLLQQLVELEDIPHYYSLNELVQRILERALGDRVVAIRTYIRPSLASESITITSSSHTSLPAINYRISVGVVLNKDKVHQRVDKGPSADDEAKVVEFKSFWGPKSELRRFHDGTIVEAVVWGNSKSTGYQAEQILEEILRYILGFHLHQLCGADGNKIHKTAITIGVNEESLSAAADRQHSHAIESLDKLRSIITSQVDGMPIGIDNLMGSCQQLRYTSLVAPQKNPIVEGSKEALKAAYGSVVSLLVNPLVVYAQYESSNKWPVEAAAVVKVKQALAIKLSHLLYEQFKIKSVVHADCLDVMHEGFLFRLVFIRDYDLSDTSLGRGTMSPRYLTIHHNNIRALHAQFPSYPNAVKLMNLWLHQHMFTGQLTAEAVELLTASVYLDPLSIHPPSSASSGFYKTLKKLVEWDWENDPLIVDITGAITSSHRVSIVMEYRASVQNKPKNFPAMYITTGIDDQSHTTFDLPEKEVLMYMIMSAKETTRMASLLQQGVDQDMSATAVRSKEIARASNVTLKFNKNIRIKRGNGAADAVPPFAQCELFANSTKNATSLKQLVVKQSQTSFCPLQEEFIQNLRHKYGRLALFFWNGMVGDELYVIWKPRALLPYTSISTLQMKNCLAILDEAAGSKQPYCIMNISKIVTEMVALGNETVVEVVYH